MTKEEFIAKNAFQLAYDYCFKAPEGVSREDFINAKYQDYVATTKKKNAKPGQTLAEAFGISPDTGLRIDDIPMKSVSRDYVVLEEEIKLNDKLVNVQIRFKYKELANV